MEEIKTKVCSCCGKELPISEFYRTNATKDGYEHYCKACRKESNKMCDEKRKYLKTQLTELKKENEELRQKLVSKRDNDLSSFDGRTLLAELKRRGYAWSDMTVMQKVDYSKI